MRYYLREKITQIFDQNSDDFSDITIVIPNKRASVYIHKHLGEHLNKVVFSPVILTISEWIDQHTPQRILTQTELLFILFEVHKEIAEETETFEQFSQWGKMLLADFDEIDRYLLDPKDVYRNLKSIKDIENWSFNTDELSPNQENFKTIWDQLILYYTTLNKKLEARNAIYQGKAYRKFSESLQEFDFKLHYFLGFNALSKSEQKIFKWFKNENLGDFSFDMDHFYYDNPNHEAKHFYEKLCQEWNLKPQLHNTFNSTPKKIEVIETSQQIAQVKIASNKIAQWRKEGINLSETVIVLADESLLIPLTESLPFEIEHANITMGYPIKFSHLNTLIELIFDIQFNYKRYRSNSIHFKAILELIEHPYIKLINGDNSKIKGFKSEVVNRNLIFIQAKELIDYLPDLEIISELISTWNLSDYSHILGSFKRFSHALSKVLQTSENVAIDLEVTYHFGKSIDRFSKIHSEYPIQFKLATFKQQLYQFWQSEELSFLGNPTQGLQIMGILETRTLDFKNIILLGMNEGVLPKTNLTNSMIPRDLKSHFGLPLEEDRQAIFPHHFYRLLQSAQKICMTYNSNAEDFGGGEVSRYITQLELELDEKYGHQFEKHTFSPSDENAHTKKVSIQNSHAIQEKLLQLLSEKGLSPSAFNTLIRCPLDFYYQYILGLREENEVEENIESSTFGTKIHDVLEAILKDNFYKDGSWLPLAIDPLKAEKKNIEKRLIEAYLGHEDSKGKQFKLSDLKYGQNKLSIDVSIEFINRFLDQQIVELKKSNDAIIPVGLEIGQEDFYASYSVNVGGQTHQIKISGQADRIDKKGNVYRIIDYKSGKCDSSKLSLKKGRGQGLHEMDEFIEFPKKGYARQLLMYALMFRQRNPSINSYSAGIISMVNLNDWLQNIAPDENENAVLPADLLDKFEAALLGKIESLFDPNYVFEHNNESDYCEHCGV